MRKRPEMCLHCMHMTVKANFTFHGQDHGRILMHWSKLKKKILLMEIDDMDFIPMSKMSTFFFSSCSI